MDFLVNWISNVPGFAVPFALAALGLILTEKSGVLSLGAEGFMLMGAMAGVGAVVVTGQPLLALVVAAAAAAVVSLIFAALVVTLRVNQVIAGLAMVFLCQGLTSLIATQEGWTSRAIVGLDPADDAKAGTRSDLLLEVTPLCLTPAVGTGNPGSGPRIDAAVERLVSLADLLPLETREAPLRLHRH